MGVGSSRQQPAEGSGGGASPSSSSFSSSSPPKAVEDDGGLAPPPPAEDAAGGFGAGDDAPPMLAASTTVGLEASVTVAVRSSAAATTTAATGGDGDGKTAARVDDDDDEEEEEEEEAEDENENEEAAAEPKKPAGDREHPEAATTEPELRKAPSIVVLDTEGKKEEVSAAGGGAPKEPTAATADDGEAADGDGDDDDDDAARRAKRAAQAAEAALLASLDAEDLAALRQQMTKEGGDAGGDIPAPAAASKGGKAEVVDDDDDDDADDADHEVRLLDVPGSQSTSAGLGASSGGLDFLSFSQGSVEFDAADLIELASSAALGFEWKDEEELRLQAMAAVAGKADDDDVDPNTVPPEGSFLPAVSEQRALLELNKAQRKAIKVCVKEARQKSEEAFDRVLDRVKKQGWTEADFRKTLRYIRDDAPLIIHFYGDRILPLLLKDTHYRNQFETKTSNGTNDNSIRVTWEARLFHDAYAPGCKGFDRPKYGVLNMMNDPLGVTSCNGHGDSYMVLRGVRLRTTFADKDSSNQDTKVASCEYYVHVFESLTDDEIRSVMEVGTGKVESKSSSCQHVYKEVQYHGPVRLDRNVECVVLNSRHRGDASVKKNIEAFCAKNNCWYDWQDGQWWHKRKENTVDVPIDLASSDVHITKGTPGPSGDGKRRWLW